MDLKRCNLVRFGGLSSPYGNSQIAKGKQMNGPLRASHYRLMCQESEKRYFDDQNATHGCLHDGQNNNTSLLPLPSVQ